jgi:hypothetical protein
MSVASISMQEHAVRKVLRGYAKDKNGNFILIGTMLPLTSFHSKRLTWIKADARIC